MLSLVVTETTEGCRAASWWSATGAATSERRLPVQPTGDVVDFGSRARRSGSATATAPARSSTGAVTGIEAHYPAAASARDRVARRGPPPGPAHDPPHPHLRGRLRRGRDPRRRQRPRADARDRHRRADPPARRPGSTRATSPSSATGPGWSTPRCGSTAHRARRRPGAARRSEEVTLTFGRDLREVSILADLAGQRSTVVVAGWDVAAKEAIAPRPAIGAIQRRARPATRRASTCSSRRSAPAPRRSCTPLPPTTAEAQARADAELRAAARRFVTAHRPGRGRRPPARRHPRASWPGSGRASTGATRWSRSSTPSTARPATRPASAPSGPGSEVRQ